MSENILEKNMQETKTYPHPFIEPTLTVLIQPEEETREIPRKKAKNVARLLEYLGIRPYTALVARDGIPLTPDQALYPKQNILVRKVMSSG